MFAIKMNCWKIINNKYIQIRKFEISEKQWKFKEIDFPLFENYLLKILFGLKKEILKNYLKWKNWN